MTTRQIDPIETIEVVPYNPAWSAIYAAERNHILSVAPEFIALEHIGSTSVPNLRAKPVVDMMAAVATLDGTDQLVFRLNGLGYSLTPTGMRNRLFLRKYPIAGGQKFHLHIVEQNTWDTRKERLMRDYLLDHPEEAAAYGALKDGLVNDYWNDSEGYTKAKTAFIQGVVDRARARLGLPSENVWEEE